MIEVPHHPDYRRNRERSGNGDYLPCVVCGKGCANPRYMVRLFWGTTVVTDDEAERIIEREGPGGDLSYYPIGADCLRRHPEIRPYIHDSRTRRST